MSSFVVIKPTMDPVQGGLMSQPTSTLTQDKPSIAQVATGSQLAKPVAPVLVNVHSCKCRALVL